MQQPIPVTILTGFLGAGKTTLLNHLIEQHSKTTFAIIENEFGDIGIDNDLVIDADSGIFELSNGCICCTLNDELVETLLNLLDSEKKFDHLLIETTGIAEPDAIAAAFTSDSALQSAYRLDGTICLVDATHATAALHEREEARRQVTFADVLILNKKSEAEPAALQALEKQLQTMNPFASIEQADFGQVQGNILNLHAYDAEQLSQKIESITAHEHHRHHTDDVVSHSFTFNEPFDFLKFMHWTRVLLLVQGERIYRVKGILDFTTEEQKMIFQSVRNTSSFQKGKPWQTHEQRQSRLVFIGNGLKRKPLEKALRSCLAK